jgi:hypothetical protein
MTMRLEAFGGSPGVLEIDPPRGLSGDQAAVTLLRSLGFEKVTVVVEQPRAT